MENPPCLSTPAKAVWKSVTVSFSFLNCSSVGFRLKSVRVSVNPSLVFSPSLSNMSSKTPCSSSSHPSNHRRRENEDVMSLSVRLNVSLKRFRNSLFISSCFNVPALTSSAITFIMFETAPWIVRTSISSGSMSDIFSTAEKSRADEPIAFCIFLPNSFSIVSSLFFIIFSAEYAFIASVASVYPSDMDLM